MDGLCSQWRRQLLAFEHFVQGCELFSRQVKTPAIIRVHAGRPASPGKETTKCSDEGLCVHACNKFQMHCSHLETRAKKDPDFVFGSIFFVSHERSGEVNAGEAEWSRLVFQAELWQRGHDLLDVPSSESSAQWTCSQDVFDGLPCFSAPKPQPEMMQHPFGSRMLEEVMDVAND